MTKMNKKGTSLVELIAVIVIMGIIAAIAVPTTIGVINRQRKNAALRSAETVVAQMKQIMIEAQTDSAYNKKDYIIADFDGTDLKMLSSDATTGTTVAQTTYKIDIDSLVMSGSVTCVYNITNGSSEFTATNWKVSNEGVTFDTDKVTVKLA